MRVKDYGEFKLFEYNSTTLSTEYTFGDIVTKENEDGIQIGVVIQVHDTNDFRVDMFGNTCNDEVRLSTMEEIKLHRPKLVDSIYMIVR